MLEEKLVRKILKSLPKKFDMKLTTIEEAQYLSTFKVVEPFGSLQTFEVFINGRSGNKNKCVSLFIHSGIISYPL